MKPHLALREADGPGHHIVFPDRVEHVMPQGDGIYAIILKSRRPEWPRLQHRGPRPRFVMVRANEAEIAELQAAMEG
jgi:hypothetical protein